MAKAQLKMIFDVRQMSSNSCKGGPYKTFEHTFDGGKGDFSCRGGRGRVGGGGGGGCGYKFWSESLQWRGVHIDKTLNSYKTLKSYMLNSLTKYWKLIL